MCEVLGRGHGQCDGLAVGGRGGFLNIFSQVVLRVGVGV